MRMSLQRSVRRLAAVLTAALSAAFVLTACGGGGGGGATGGGLPVAGLIGDYQLVYLQHDLTAGRVYAITARYAGAADGSLAGVEGYGANDLGASSGPFVPSDLTWSVGAGRALSIPMLTAGTFQGTVAPDGSFAAGGESAVGNAPMGMLMLRARPDPTLDDLFGEWWMLTLNKPSAAVLRSQLAETIVSPTGVVFTDSTVTNVDGVITTGTGAPPVGALSILSGGRVALNLGGGLDMIGALSERGDVLLLGTASGLAGVQMRVLVRRDLLVRAEAAQRTWAGLGGFATPGSGYISVFGSAVLEGLPTDHLTLVYNSAGLVTMPATVAASVSAQPSGVLNAVLGPSAQESVGALARREPFAFLSLVEPGQEPFVMWLIE